MIDEDALNIYTDGSCLPSPRRGGIGVVFIWVNSAGHEETLEISKPGYKGETIGRMELLACIEALKEAQNLPSYCDYEKITIYSDSQYVVSNKHEIRLVQLEMGC